MTNPPAQTLLPMPFSVGALTQLTLALHRYLAAPTAESVRLVTEAIACLCLEARHRGRGLKPMLAAVNAAWPVMPGRGKNAPQRERIALDRVLRQSLDAYYRVELVRS